MAARDDSGTGGRGRGGSRGRGDSGSRGRGRGGSRGHAGRTGKPPRDEARNAAYDLMRAVGERDAYANLLLPRLLRERGLTGRDAALATELAYGTLRGQGTYDAIIDVCVDRRPDPDVLDALRLGAHQLLRMRIPPHAAVGTTVDLARLRIGPGAAKFVNAVLRKVGARTLEEWTAIVAPSAEEDPVGHLAVVHSHPRWIVSALRDAVGERELPALLEADNARPAVTLVARPGRASVEELLEAGARRARLSPYAAYLPEGDPGRIPAVAEYRAAVQDEASQLVALALTRVPLDGREREVWLDMCAGPGGKAGLLDAIATHGDPAGPGSPAAEGSPAPVAFPGGARLLAADVQHHRARLVRQATADAAVITADGTEPAWRPGAFDRIMLDAPCTGLGALRRRPEARWRRGAAGVPELTALQRRLLDSAIDALRPGGVVAYVTCSPHLAETQVVVADALKRHPELEQLDARAFLPEVDGLGDGPHAQFWPHRHGTDAMFLALLRKAG
ncbi:RsmB/NOP family class I SAM-dependent RNA methyltransferase [Thermoactinospora rubra]|uniref:RsmB/NOP family class I SAM-dependent RNA methyltransferase n=1 Tax=Thermoactinospora rubra TaxID=1088767 RepID=UPI000A11C44C|nr:transcription antitermination factor NusB [Thermoactinospora rubra]